MTENAYERQAIVDRLRSLSLPELVDVLQRVLPEHDDDGGGTSFEQRLVLAKVELVGGTARYGSEDPAVIVRPVGWPDDDYYEGQLGLQPGLWEAGSCSQCDLDVISNVKRVFCPICRNICYLT